MTGSLTIIGSGIQAVRHFTLESCQVIEQADKVLYAVPDPITELYIKKIRPDAESLSDSYSEGKRRIKTYQEMKERTLGYVRQGLHVCVIYYGHPGVFVKPSHESIRQARSEGFEAHMFPGVSAEDCLFADLGIDPGIHGCQSFDATDFLIRRCKFDTSSHLILWQIGLIGELAYTSGKINKRGLEVLVDFLGKYYDQDHKMVVYEASVYSICKPIIQHTSLSKLVQRYVSYGSTLYIPPIAASPQQLNHEMIERLGLSSELEPTGLNFSVKKLFHLGSGKRL